MKMTERAPFDSLPEDTVVYSGAFSYDTALIGYDVRSGRAVYDYDKMVEWIVNRNPGWTEEDAIEWIDYNTLGAHCEGEPIVMQRIE